MALEYVGGTLVRNAVGATTYTVDLTSLTGGTGSQPEENDIVIVATGFVTTAFFFTPGVKSPTDFTTLPAPGYLRAIDSRDCLLSVDWKIMTSTPDTSVTVGAGNSTSLGNVTCVHVWRNVDTTNPMDVTITTATGANSAIPNPPAITPVTPGAVMLVVGAGSSNVLEDSFDISSGFANNEVKGGQMGSNYGYFLAIGSKDWVSGTEDPAAFTNVTTAATLSWCAATIALRPAAGGAADTTQFFAAF
jgi:hypothetical protein